MQGSISRVRADLYRVLSTLYAPPSKDCKDVREALTRIPSLIDALRRYGYRLEWRALELGDCSDYVEEYTRLFVLGDPAPLCPPYESIMLGHEQLMAEPALRVIESYRAMGFQVSEESPIPPEHIAVELEFMYILAILDSNPEVARHELAFLEEHLAFWAGRLASCIEAKSRNPLLIALARLTRSFTAEDHRILSKVVGGL